MGSKIVNMHIEIQGGCLQLQFRKEFNVFGSNFSEHLLFWCRMNMFLSSDVIFGKKSWNTKCFEWPENLHGYLTYLKSQVFQNWAKSFRKFVHKMRSNTEYRENGCMRWPSFLYCCGPMGSNIVKMHIVVQCSTLQLPLKKNWNPSDQSSANHPLLRFMMNMFLACDAMFWKKFIEYKVIQKSCKFAQIFISL